MTNLPLLNVLGLLLLLGMGLSPLNAQTDKLPPLTNFTAERTGNIVHLNWDPPTENREGASYYLVRSDRKFIYVPEALIDTTYVDTLDNVQGSINYELYYGTIEGEGERVVSDIFYYLEDGLLFYEWFDLDVLETPENPLDYPQKWTIASKNSDATWMYMFGVGLDENRFGGSIWFLGGPSYEEDHYVKLISPIINTSGYSELSIQFNTRAFGDNSQGTGEFFLETTSDGGDTWSPVYGWQLADNFTGKVSQLINNSDIGSSNFQFAISAKGHEGLPFTTVVDNFIISGEPIIDLKSENPEIPDLIEPNTTLDLTGIVENLSSINIDGEATFQIIDRISNTVVLSETLALQNLEVAEQRIVDFGDWNTVEGEYIIEINVSKEEDIVEDNNVFKQELDVLKLMDRDLVLIESFTGTQCTECAEFALAIKDLENEDFPIATLGYHKLDEFEIPITDEKANKYGVLFYPMLMIDRQSRILADRGAVNTPLDFRPFITKASERKSPIEITFTNTERATDHFTVDVNVNALSPINDPSYQLTVALVENNIPKSWKGLEEVDHVALIVKEYSLDLSNQQSIHPFEVTIPDSANPENLEVIAFVQSRRQTLNTSKLAMPQLVDTETILPTSTGTKIYPNPTLGLLYLDEVKDFEQIELFDYTGKLIRSISMNESYLDISTLIPGIYFLKLTSKTLHKTFTAKIVKE